MALVAQGCLLTPDQITKLRLTTYKEYDYFSFYMISSAGKKGGKDKASTDHFGNCFYRIGNTPGQNVQKNTSKTQSTINFNFLAKKKAFDKNKERVLKLS